MPEFQTTPGTRDILPPDAARWRLFVEVFAGVVESAGYEQIILPMFEDLGVFQRLGDATDVVTKEMYDFVDKGGRHVALRPEQTAGVCRAFVQHHPNQPWKVWYSGPNFRYEKAQQGRYRQFDQVGIEVLGVDDPLLDVEVIALAHGFYRALGLRNVELHVNSLGDTGDRARYVAALESYFRAHEIDLTKESRATLERNPLRVLDSKRAEDREVIAQAPSISEFFSPTAAAHFAAVQEGLSLLGIDFVVNDRLVRGLDYYRSTTFEFVSTALEAAQTAVGGGGRYDGLVEDLGGEATPGIGFAIGLDRTLLACDAESVFQVDSSGTDVFVVDTTGGRSALLLTTELRAAGLRADRAFGSKSMKSQMKSANKSRAAVAVIIGEDELARGIATVRPMDGGEQSECPLDQVVVTVADIVKKAK
ncbi:MAG: histidine--tRNA ligase [Actinobacteria bacterium]|nr:histidine--tRNA ligase [Actinomycetota bacterium]NBP53017.1 histidine--tRNA ligase [Actinomycetota bacterium]